MARQLFHIASSNCAFRAFGLEALLCYKPNLRPTFEQVTLTWNLKIILAQGHKMSHNWGQTGNQDFLDSLLTDFQLCADNTQGSSFDPVPQGLFDSGHSHDNLIDPVLAEWPWAGDSNPPSGQAAQSSTEVAASAADHNDKDISSDLAPNASDLETRLESRIAQFEEKMNALQKRLEEKATSLCDEIDVHVQKLRDWAREVETLIDQVKELRDAYQAMSQQ